MMARIARSLSRAAFACSFDEIFLSISFSKSECSSGRRCCTFVKVEAKSQNSR
jgi:hypothetical protein